MEITEPSLIDTVKRIHADYKDCKRIIVHPLFISPFGKHITVDIPLLITQAKDHLAGLNWDGDVVLTECYGDSLDTLADGVSKNIEKFI
jgi:sirohydrochlorin ferrochelatase